MIEYTSVFRRLLVGALAISALACPSLLGEQGQRPLSPLPRVGLRVAPFFDGWYANPDGTVTLSFGYSNLNRDEAVEIPFGPDNFITPKQYDGRQPTHFVPGGSAPADGLGPTGSDRRDRQRGVFTITVPAGFQENVVWTLNIGGQSYKVPANTNSGAYQLRWPMAMGSVPPLLRFTADGPAGRGPAGIQGPPMKVSAGTPLSVSIWLDDDSVREDEPVPVRQRQKRMAMNVNWYKHTGPGPVVFSEARQPIEQLTGTATTSVTFKQPGEYVIRVRADNFGRLDTSAGNQCCWTNGYVKVTVAP